MSPVVCKLTLAFASNLLFLANFNDYKFIKLDNGIKILIKDLKKYKLNNKKFSSVNFYRLQKLDQINKTKKIRI